MGGIKLNGWIIFKKINENMTSEFCIKNIKREEQLDEKNLRKRIFMNKR